MDQEAKLEIDDFRGIGARYFDSAADPYPLFDGLRATAPIWVAPWGDIFLSRYDDVRQVLADKTLVAMSPQRAIELWSEMPRSTINDWMLFGEGHAHRFLHEAFKQPFSPEGMASLQTVVEEVVRECVLEGEIDGECEVVSCFTRSIPERIISDLLGFSREDLPLIRAWSLIIRDDLLDGLFDETRAAAAAAPDEMADYFSDSIARRLRTGAELPPLLSGFDAIIDRLGIQAAGSDAAFFALAAHETTVHLLGNMLYLLAREPEHWRRLGKDSALIPKAVGEALRLESPVQKLSRFATEPVVIGGERIEAGSNFVLLIGAANRDPDRFAAPHRFDLARRGPPHLAFGRGLHACIGRALAEMEAAAVLRFLLPRWSSVEAVEGGARWIANSSFRGLEELRLRFHA